MKGSLEALLTFELTPRLTYRGTLLWMDQELELSELPRELVDYSADKFETQTVGRRKKMRRETSRQLSPLVRGAVDALRPHVGADTPIHLFVVPTGKIAKVPLSTLELTEAMNEEERLALDLNLRITYLPAASFLHLEHKDAISMGVQLSAGCCPELRAIYAAAAARHGGGEVSPLSLEPAAAAPEILHLAERLVPLSGGAVALEDSQVPLTNLEGTKLVIITAKVFEPLAVAEALLSRGVRSVVQLLWDVAASETAAFVKAFTQRLVHACDHGARPSLIEVLEAAQQEVRSQGNPPSSWGGFVLYGQPSLPDLSLHWKAPKFELKDDLLVKEALGPVQQLTVAAEVLACGFLQLRFGSSDKVLSLPPLRGLDFDGPLVRLSYDAALRPLEGAAFEEAMDREAAWTVVETVRTARRVGFQNFDLLKHDVLWQGLVPLVTFSCSSDLQKIADCPLDEPLPDKVMDPAEVGGLLDLINHLGAWRSKKDGVALDLAELSNELGAPRGPRAVQSGEADGTAAAVREAVRWVLGNVEDLERKAPEELSATLLFVARCHALVGEESALQAAEKLVEMSQRALEASAASP